MDDGDPADRIAEEPRQRLQAARADQDVVRVPGRIALAPDPDGG
jgi:hypothetical protein